MGKKTPIIELHLIHPHHTRKRKFACSECGMVYNLKDYRVLFDSHKISYFSEEDGKFKICHDCVMSFSTDEKKRLKVPKLIVKLILPEEEVILKFQ